MTKEQLEEGTAFTPRFDAQGLIPCITTSAHSGEVLMFAWMNAESLQKTLKTGEAHYWSRSRNELWHKGASSGLTQKIIEIRTDCDQDCIWIKVEVPTSAQTNHKEASCHTGRQSCFYRTISINDADKSVQLEFKDAGQIFNPADVYGK